jgi:hypothetical protein
MDLRMRALIAFETQRRNHTFGDRALGHATPGDVDLDDLAGHKIIRYIGAHVRRGADTRAGSTSEQESV